MAQIKMDGKAEAVDIEGFFKLRLINIHSSHGIIDLASQLIHPPFGFVCVAFVNVIE